MQTRHLDTRVFVDVPQITAGYTAQRQATLAGGISPSRSPVAPFAQQLGINLNPQGADRVRPTISYLPQTGARFVRNLKTPINSRSGMLLLPSGCPADRGFYSRWTRSPG